jgi:D-3-phosphoglycerate dehydrogenase / 2-oxoglutarate reductase
MDRIRTLTEVAAYEPWIDQQPLKMYSSADLAERITAEAASVVIVESDSCKGPVFALDPPLLMLGVTRGDPNNVDLAAATAAGVPVVNTPGRNADAVAEIAVGLVFAVARHLVRAHDEVRAGETYKDGTIPYQRFRAWELNGRTAGLVGLGAVARALRWRLQGLGMEVIAYDPYNDEADVSLDELWERSDVVSVHAPVTDETRGMIGAKQFAAMKPGALFVNTARADVHDTDALVEALQSGHLGGAGLDHFVGENIAADHPLCSMGNVVLSPHIGGATYDTEARQATMVADDLERVLAGKRPKFLANPEVP